jgi:hypothetical protein
MSYTHLYDVNEIPIDRFYYAGIDDIVLLQYMQLFILNYNLSKRKIETLWGPAFDENGLLIDGENDRFAIGIYLTKDAINALSEEYKPKHEISLREALEKLFELHDFPDLPPDVLFNHTP